MHNTLIEVAILGTALILAFSYAAFAYGQRKVELAAATHAASIAKVRYESETLRRALAERDARATNTPCAAPTAPLGDCFNSSQL